MRIGRRRAVILAAAAAGVLATAGVALAAANSTVSFNFTPSNLPTNTFMAGKLNVHTHTNYTNPGNANPGGATERAQLFFDDDGKLNANATPRCTPSGGDLANAMSQCASAKVGSGTAKASANGAFTINGCVLVFNGKKNAAGQNTVILFTRVNVANPSTMTCGSPASNHQGNTTVILKGVLKANPTSLPADYVGGPQVDFNNITSVAAFPLTDFNVNVQKGSYVSARCHDGDHKLNLRTKFTYNNNTTQTVNASKACT